MAKDQKKAGARAKLRQFFQANLGRVVTSNELRAVAGISEWARRVRELRDEEGMQILTHNDRVELKSNQYLLETLELQPVIAREISPEIRKQIFERNGFTCQICGAGTGDDAPCEPGKKVRFQIDHIVPISQGGTDKESNLRTTCVYYNKEKANILRTASIHSISALAMIRKLPRDVQIEVYEWLRKKFESSQ